MKLSFIGGSCKTCRRGILSASEKEFSSSYRRGKDSASTSKEFSSSYRRGKDSASTSDGGFCKCFVAAVVLAASTTFAAKPDAKAVGWFPQKVRDAGITDARQFDFAPGVEYGYAYVTNLFGHPGDLHVVRIELAKAKVRPFVEEGSLRADDKLRTTSAAAASTKALFSVNGGFFCWKDNPAKNLKALIPYYRMKLDGNVLPSNAGGTFGLAYSADGSRVKVGSVKDAELPDWENFMAGEGVLSKGKCSLEMKRPTTVKTRPEAPRTGLGMDPEGKYLYVFVTGGRRTGKNPSMGLSYLDFSDMMAWFGCSEGVNMDGGGSTTLAVRKDALLKAKAKKPYTPEAHPAAKDKSIKGADDYVILNCTSDGSERAVLDHIQFLDEKSLTTDLRADAPKASKRKGSR